MNWWLGDGWRTIPSTVISFVLFRLRIFYCSIFNFTNSFFCPFPSDVDSHHWVLFHFYFSVPFDCILLLYWNSFLKSHQECLSLLIEAFYDGCFKIFYQEILTSVSFQCWHLWAVLFELRFSFCVHQQFLVEIWAFWVLRYETLFPI